MPTNRKVVFANDEIYHVFNRGVEKRPTFTNKREFNRALITLNYYRFAHPPIKLSKFLVLPESDRAELIKNIESSYQKLVEILCYCFMPNHFHFLLKQKIDNGISIFTANFTNSYTRYFNSKEERIGPLFQGIFKAVLIESDEQLIHVSRYIHLNPVSSFLVKAEELENYEWSSYPEYLNSSAKQFTIKREVLDLLSKKEASRKYKEFVLNQVDYAKKLERIKHLILE